MTDYKQTSITGTSWQRAWRVECENPLQGQREVVFHEEQVLNAGEHQIRAQVGRLRVPLTAENAPTEFPLLDPDTGAQVGTATYLQVYCMLHSLYMHGALERDVQTAALTEQPLSEADPG